MNKLFKNLRYLPILGLMFLMLFACEKETTSPSDNGNNTDQEGNGKHPSAGQAFLGDVGKDVPRVKKEKVTLKMNYKDNIEEQLRVNIAPKPQYSVGLYAPAGATVTISIPTGANGLTAQIGAWKDDIPGIPGMDETISSEKELVAGENEITNEYGGPIYIIASSPMADPVTLSFTGAVKMPDFVLGKTNPTDWWDHLQQTEVPWLELQAPNMIVTVPRGKLLEDKIKDPTNLLKAWNKIVQQELYEWTGVSENPDETVDQQPMLPYRMVLDKRIFKRGRHNGYPIVLSSRGDLLNAVAELPDLDTDVWRGFQLLGKNFQQPAWNWDGIKETTDKLGFVKAAHDSNIAIKKWPSALDIDLNTAFSHALDFVKNDKGDKTFGQDLSNPWAKLLPFIQIFDKATPAGGNGDSGYDFMTFLSKRARRVNPVPATNEDKHNFFYKALCDFTGENWALFFNAWGISISSDAEQDILNEGYPFMDKNIWTYNPITDTGGLKTVNPYENKNWRILDFSSQETIQSEQNLGGGFASYAIDGDINTYWLANWSSGADAVPPHSLTIDMGVLLKVGSFYFVRRQNGGENVAIKNAVIKVSKDGKHWNDLTTFYLQNITQKQTRPLSSEQTFRYFKMIVPTLDDKYNSGGPTIVGLAEIGVDKEQKGTNPTPPSSDPYNVANWSIHSTNSEVTTGVEGAGGGHAENIIDDDINTYWNADWQAGDLPPFNIVVDMKQKLAVSAFTFVQRQSETFIRTRINNIQILVSDNLINWKDLGTFSLDVNNENPQTISLQSSEEFRYFKLVIPDRNSIGTQSDHGKFAALAEVSVNKN